MQTLLYITALAVSALIPALCSATPIACTPAELAVAKKAVTGATAALGNAIPAIDAGDAATLGRLDKWLGVKNSAEAKAVKTRLMSVSTWLGSATFLCESQTLKIGEVYAYVRADQNNVLIITLSSFFFGAADTGQNSKLGVLIHEASHFNLSGAAKDPKVYGPSEALALAKSSPTAAQENAENIQYFVESVYFGLNP